ncbi:hypothetical protein Trydic_g11659 [Trypoxylus dichotomus]
MMKVKLYISRTFERGRIHENQALVFDIISKPERPALNPFVHNLTTKENRVSVSNARKVTLLSVERSLSGLFQCEVSADAPLFHTAVRAAEMTVAVVPDGVPTVSVDRARLERGGPLIAECFAPPAYPAPNLTWYVNDQRHCLRTSYSVWDGSFYEQTDGVAMGSPLSPVVANLFMEQFESLAIETAVDKPTVWWRCVDDTLVIWPHGRDKLDRFLEHLNGVHSNIQFTMELEHNGELPFLDVRVNRDQVRATTSVFRKPTQTGRYLHNQPNHHPGQKNMVVRTLVERARKANSCGVCARLQGQR